MGGLATRVFEPGFFTSGPVHVAIAIGTVVAVVSAVTGVFTVMRGQSFAGHALTDVATAGGSGAFLIGMSPLFGFVGLSAVGAGVLELIGVQRARGRDLVTGLVLGVAIGLAALFLYLDATATATSGATQQILFGSIFTTQASTIPIVVAFSAAALGAIAIAYRPLLLSTVSTDIAAARGAPVRAAGLLYMLALSLSVGLSSLAIGTILSTALLIGPPAAALRLTKSTGRALVAACLIGIGATWLGVLLAYDSFYWGASRQALPVSFFIVAIVFAAYLLSGLRVSAGARARAAAVAGAGQSRATA